VRNLEEWVEELCFGEEGIDKSDGLAHQDIDSSSIM
jgi:hypothetical protein